MATMIQPIVSSRIAEATMIWPRSRRMKFISRTTIATIFTEEIDSAVPRNSEVTKRASGLGRIESGSISPSAKPQMNGTATPAAETAIAARPTRLHQPQIGLHAGEQQQHQDAELRHGIDHALLLGALRKQRVLRFGPDEAEYGRAEQEAADELPHHSRLADSLRRFTHGAADDEQKADLGEENRLRAALAAGAARSGAFGRNGCGRSKENKNDNQEIAQPRALGEGPGR